MQRQRQGRADWMLGNILGSLQLERFGGEHKPTVWASMGEHALNSVLQSHVCPVLLMRQTWLLSARV